MFMLLDAAFLAVQRHSENRRIGELLARGVVAPHEGHLRVARLERGKPAGDLLCKCATGQASRWLLPLLLAARHAQGLHAARRASSSTGSPCAVSSRTSVRWRTRSPSCRETPRHTMPPRRCSKAPRSPRERLTGPHSRAAERSALPRAARLRRRASRETPWSDG